MGADSVGGEPERGAAGDADLGASAQAAPFRFPISRNHQRRRGEKEQPVRKRSRVMDAVPEPVRRLPPELPDGEEMRQAEEREGECKQCRIDKSSEWIRRFAAEVLARDEGRAGPDVKFTDLVRRFHSVRAGREKFDPGEESDC